MMPNRSRILSAVNILPPLANFLMSFCEINFPSWSDTNSDELKWLFEVTQEECVPKHKKPTVYVRANNFNNFLLTLIANLIHSVDYGFTWL